MGEGRGADHPLVRYLSGWSPQPEQSTDVVDPARAALLADLLDLPVPTRELPPLWHWIYFTAWPQRRRLNDDGHPSDGAFQPPIPGRRRMWAGDSLRIMKPLMLGEPATRTASLVSADAKSGRSGDMLLVRVRYDYEQGGGIAISETQDHVYRGPDSAAPRQWGQRPRTLPASAAPWQYSIGTDPVQLFRMSSVTANSHRIHYDRPYAQDVEGYPDLVVHGPLLALQVAGLADRFDPALRLSELSFRLTNPVFVAEPVLAEGTPTRTQHGVRAELRVISAPDRVHLSATASYADLPGAAR